MLLEDETVEVDGIKIGIVYPWPPGDDMASKYAFEFVASAVTRHNFDSREAAKKELRATHRDFLDRRARAIRSTLQTFAAMGGDVAELFRSCGLELKEYSEDSV